MSPEQVSGGKATPRSDLYSVGVTVYELLTGKLPITGTNTYQIMLGHMNQIPVPPHEIAPQVPVALSAVVMRALEKDPDRRFAAAEEFLHGLQSAPAVAGQDVAPAMPAHGPATALTKPYAPAARPPTTSMEQKPSSGSGFENLPLEELRRKLAVYIGPVAKFVVKKLAAQHGDLDTIYREAAKQIPSDADRAAFLRSKGQ
jgi:eukaryotic-like serine/threonine-protein kinase